MLSITSHLDDLVIVPDGDDHAARCHTEPAVREPLLHMTIVSQRTGFYEADSFIQVPVEAGCQSVYGWGTPMDSRARPLALAMS